LDALLGQHAPLLPLKELLIDRTEGNPLYLEEVVRALVETHVLEGSRGAYRQTAAVTEVEVPATVQAILAARIDRLSPENKRVLQTAAVIGKDVSYALLAAIAESTERELRPRLADLQAAEFVYEAHLFPELQYTFKHALTHEVAYATLLQERRKALHAKIVDAVEQLYTERVGEWMDRLGQHALRAERWDKAAMYLREAGVRAAGRSAHREAVTHLEQAIVALERLPEDLGTLRALVDLRISLRSSLFPLGEHKRITDHLRDAAGLANKLGDRLRYGRVLAFQAHANWSSGEPLQAASLAERALAIGNAEQDLRLTLLASHFLGQAYHQHGDYVRGVNVISAAIPKLVGELEQEHSGLALPLSIVFRTWLAFCHAGLGEFEAGLARASEAMALAEQFGRQPYSEFHARFGQGVTHALRGDSALAVATLEPAMEIARNAGLAVMASSGEIYLGYAYLLGGDTARAVENLEEPLLKSDQLATLAFHLYARGLLGEAYLASGKIEQARRLGETALELCRNHNQRGYEAEVLYSLGTIYAPRLKVGVLWFQAFKRYRREWQKTQRVRAGLSLLGAPAANNNFDHKRINRFRV
jgi:tetratricopeptide (TPR) repeat protein